jgi:hypothetical protein
MKLHIASLLLLSGFARSEPRKPGLKQKEKPKHFKGKQFKHTHAPGGSRIVRGTQTMTAGEYILSLLHGMDVEHLSSTLPDSVSSCNST